MALALFALTSCGNGNDTGNANGNNGAMRTADLNWNNPNWQFVHANHPTYINMPNNFTFVTNNNRLYFGDIRTFPENDADLLSEDAMAVFRSSTILDTLYLSTSNELRYAVQFYDDGSMSRSIVIAENVADVVPLFNPAMAILQQSGMLTLRLDSYLSTPISESVAKIRAEHLSGDGTWFFITQAGELYSVSLGHRVIPNIRQQVRQYNSADLSNYVVRTADTVIRDINISGMPWFLCSFIHENGETGYFLTCGSVAGIRFYLTEEYAQFFSNVDYISGRWGDNMGWNSGGGRSLPIIFYLLTSDGIVLSADQEHLNEVGAFRRLEAGVVSEHFYPNNPNAFYPILNNVRYCQLVPPFGRRFTYQPLWFLSMNGELFFLDSDSNEYIMRYESVHMPIDFSWLPMILFSDGTVIRYIGDEAVTWATSVKLPR